MLRSFRRGGARFGVASRPLDQAFGQRRDLRRRLDEVGEHRSGGDEHGDDGEYVRAGFGEEGGAKEALAGGLGSHVCEWYVLAVGKKQTMRRMILEVNDRRGELSNLCHCSDCRFEAVVLHPC